MRRLALAFSLLALAGIGLAACGGDGDEEGTTQAEQTDTTQAEQTGTTTAAADGAQVFDDNGCGSCHTLAAAGSTGQTGPDLDDVLKGKSEDFIRTSIVDPNAEIAEGYSEGVMPESFGDDLSPEELDALVQYLAQSTSGGGG